MASRKIEGAFACSSASINTIPNSFGCETRAQQKTRVNRSLKNRKPGDMIKIPRSGYFHYAIYLGNDKVVDLVSDNGGEVCSRGLYETVGRSECTIDNYLDNEHTPYTEEQIVQRALLEIPKRLTYDVKTNNCEHFATWCRYGIKKCHQPCEVAAILNVKSK